MNERVSIGSEVAPQGSGPIANAVAAWKRCTNPTPVQRDRLMQLWVDAEVLRLGSLRAQAKREKGVPGPEGSILKLLSGTGAHRRGRAGRRPHGPGGHAARRAVHDASSSTRARPGATTRCWRSWPPQAATIAGGTTQIQMNIIGERVLGLPREPGLDPNTPWSQIPRNWGPWTHPSTPTSPTSCLRRRVPCAGGSTSNGPSTAQVILECIGAGAAGTDRDQRPGLALARGHRAGNEGGDRRGLPRRVPRVPRAGAVEEDDAADPPCLRERVAAGEDDPGRAGARHPVHRAPPRRRWGSSATASAFGSILPAAWSFVLALRSRGLGTVWTTAHLWNQAAAAEVLGIPDGGHPGGDVPGGVHHRHRLQARRPPAARDHHVVERVGRATRDSHRCPRCSGRARRTSTRRCRGTTGCTAPSRTASPSGVNARQRRRPAHHRHRPARARRGRGRRLLPDRRGGRARRPRGRRRGVRVDRPGHRRADPPHRPARWHGDGADALAGFLQHGRRRPLGRRGRSAPARRRGVGDARVRVERDRDRAADLDAR